LQDGLSLAPSASRARMLALERDKQLKKRKNSLDKDGIEKITYIPHSV
jgi:hypothetical protein